ncbi:unnamed protein product [Musa hybrid cultivar]
MVENITTVDDGVIAEVGDTIPTRERHHSELLFPLDQMRNYECQQDSITDALPPPVPQKFAIATDKKHKKEIDADAKPTRYIPMDIVESILMRMNPKHAMRLSLVCKDWRAVAARLEEIMRKTPWLIVSKYPKETFRVRSVVNKEVSFKIKVDGFPMSRTMFYNCSYGWLVTVLNLYNPMILFNPFSGAWLELPAYEPSPSFLCMSSAPTTPDCILLAHDYVNRLYVWRPGHTFWTIEKNILEDFDTILSFEGKFYAWHWHSGCLTIFKVLPVWSRKLVVPCPIDFTSCREPIVSLVESCGNILLVCIMKRRRQPLVIHVFRLDLENKAWIRMKNLGDQALFMAIPDNHVTSISASEIGCSANCIYLTGVWKSFEHGEFSVYNMDNHSIESFPKFNETRKKKYVAIDKNHKREIDDTTRKIRYIPIDIVESILTRMNTKDIMRLSVVCKDWRAISVRFDPVIRKIPWLISTRILKAAYHLRSVVDDEDTFKIKFPEIPLGRTLFYNCSHGWLVIEPDLYSPTILLNPFSSVWLQLPACKPVPNSFVYMSSAPTNLDCILLARDYSNHLCVWRPRDESWTLEEGMLEPFETIISFKGQFYTWDHQSMFLTIFQVLPLRLRKLVVPCPFDSSGSYVRNVSLVESCENILLVCVMKHPLQSLVIFLFRLDLENKVWIKMESLGDQALFMAIPCNQVISVSAHEVGCSTNCIYLTGAWQPFPDGEFHVYNMDSHIIESFPKFVGHNRPHYGCNRLWITPS